MKTIETSASAKVALQGSIKKWTLIVDAFVRAEETGEDPVYWEGGVSDCPLCALFHNARTPVWSRCVGCPISADTGEPYCQGTPYTDWDNSDLWRYDRETTDNAQAMLDYLVDLDARTVVQP